MQQDLIADISEKTGTGSAVAFAGQTQRMSCRWSPIAALLSENNVRAAVVF
jgi:hypothetical protein